MVVYLCVVVVNVLIYITGLFEEPKEHLSAYTFKNIHIHVHVVIFALYFPLLQYYQQGYVKNTPTLHSLLWLSKAK